MEPRFARSSHGAARLPQQFCTGFQRLDVGKSFIRVRLHMKNLSWLSRLLNPQPSLAMFLGMLVAMFLAAACIAVAQTPAVPASAPEAQMSVPNGYSVHESVDVGGRMSGISGSGAMYDTMVNLQSGPRVLGETFELHALPGKKNAPLDDLRVFASGFGGDPNNLATLDFSKSKYYEFSGMFRRDRQYFDYDLLGNPGIPSGYSIPISGSTTPYAWPQVMQSPFLYNTVRHMTGTNFTVLPLSKVTFRFAYSQNIFQGPSLTPSGNSVAGSEVLLQEYQRNSTDDFTGAIDWKPVQGTKLTYEEQIDHYKGDSYFTMAPQYFTVQESDGTKVALLDSYQQFVPYGYSSTTGAFAASSICNSSSMISFDHDTLCQSQRRLANHRSGVQRHQQLCPVPADARHLPHRDLPAAKLEHQECLDERRCPLHQREHESAQLLRELPGPGQSQPRARLCGQSQRETGSDGLRLRHRLAGVEDGQPRGPGELLQRSPAGNGRVHQRDHRDGAHDGGRGNHQLHGNDLDDRDQRRGALFRRSRDWIADARLLRPAVHHQQLHGELGRDAAQHLLAHLALPGSSDLRRPGNLTAQYSDSGQQYEFRRGDHSRKRRDLQRRPASHQ